MHLTKHHGLGNDFLIALADGVPDNADDLARRLCHRTHGIGADGLIFGTPADNADLCMTLFNSDGSRAEISGNGIRCLAQAQFAVQDTRQLQIATAGGLRRVELMSSHRNQVQISVQMGAVGDGPALVAIDELARPGFSATRVATAEVGNPHVVLDVEDLGAVNPGLDGPAIEACWKPDGINVHFLSHTGPDQVTLLHWERGAGVTEACGSGAVASATVAHQWGLVGTEVEVVMPGGTARVQVGSDATLIGPAVHVADIDVSDSDLADD